MTGLRLLFISWSTVGGSGRSQRQLAAELEARGHEVLFVVHDPRPAKATRAAYRRLSNLSARTEGRSLGRPVAWLRDRPGRRTTQGEVEGLRYLRTPVPQNALIEVVRELRPDVVVANSVDRWAWRRINALCREHEVPSVLYIREESSLEHLDTGSVPDLLLANTSSLAARMEDRGYPCAYVPSVIDAASTATESTRKAALAINPIPIKGSELLWELAERLPDIPFVAQESWELTGADLDTARRRARDLPNLELRRAGPPGPGLYGDARVLLAPYLVDSRPRVVLEAQANGIPVIASDVPALVDAVGEGGVNLPTEGLDSVDRWVETMRSLWEDEALYARLSAAARAHASRPDVAPEVIAETFERLVLAVAGPRKPRV